MDRTPKLGTFNGHAVARAQDVIRASREGSLHLKSICGEPKRYVYRDIGKLAYSRDEAAKWFAEQLGFERLPDEELILEQMI